MSTAIKKGVTANIAITIAICLCQGTLAWAADAPPKGFVWYNVPPAPAADRKKGAQAQQGSAVEAMRRLHRRVSEARARAVLTPTEQNVRAYLTLQNHVVQQAARFAAVWAQTLLDYPGLDYNIAHPVESGAQPVLAAERGAQIEAAIRHFAADNGLFFFYRGGHALDRTLAPSIAAFAEQYHIALIPVSVDGRPVESLPGSRRDRGQADALHIRYFPALVLVNPKTGQSHPLAYGFVAQDELKRRFLEVATHFREGVT